MDSCAKCLIENIQKTMPCVEPLFLFQSGATNNLNPVGQWIQMQNFLLFQSHCGESSHVLQYYNDGCQYKNKDRWRQIDAKLLRKQQRKKFVIFNIRLSFRFHVGKKFWAAVALDRRWKTFSTDYFPQNFVLTGLFQPALLLQSLELTLIYALSFHFYQCSRKQPGYANFTRSPSWLGPLLRLI